MGNPLSMLAVLCIRGYQRFLSRRKGYKCIHHQVYTQGSCSNFGLTAYREHGILEATRMTRNRLRECSRVYRAAVSRLTKDEYETHWQARGFMVSPHEVMIAKLKAYLRY